MSRKRVAIIFECGDHKPLTETGGTGFRVWIEGADATKGLPQDAWTAAEFYGMHGFLWVLAMLRDSGMPITTEVKGAS